MNPFLSTALHTFEIIVIVGLVWLVTYLFPGLVPSDAVKDVLMVALVAAAKFARASSTIDVPDYVNGEK